MMISQANFRLELATSILDETAGFFGIADPSGSKLGFFRDFISKNRSFGAYCSAIAFHLNHTSTGAGAAYKFVKSSESRASAASDSNTSSMIDIAVAGVSAVATAPVSRQCATKWFESLSCSSQTLNINRGRRRDIRRWVRRVRATGANLG